MGKAPSSSPDWGGQFASQEESQALGDRPLSEMHCLNEAVFLPSDAFGGVVQGKTDLVAHRLAVCVAQCISWLPGKGEKRGRPHGPRRVHPVPLSNHSGTHRCDDGARAAHRHLLHHSPAAVSPSPSPPCILQWLRPLSGTPSPSSGHCRTCQQDSAGDAIPCARSIARALR